MQSQVLVTNYVDKPSNIINILHSLYTELVEYPIICLWANDPSICKINFFLFPDIWQHWLSIKQFVKQIGVIPWQLGTFQYSRKELYYMAVLNFENKQINVLIYEFQTWASVLANLSKLPVFVFQHGSDISIFVKSHSGLTSNRKINLTTVDLSAVLMLLMWEMSVSTGQSVILGIHYI